MEAYDSNKSRHRLRCVRPNATTCGATSFFALSSSSPSPLDTDREGVFVCWPCKDSLAIQPTPPAIDLFAPASGTLLPVTCVGCCYVCGAKQKSPKTKGEQPRLNIKNWRFGFNESALHELARWGAEGEHIAETLLPLVEARVVNDETLLPEPEPEEEANAALDRPPEPPGTLEVKVIRAKHLRDMEMFGKMSPYIKITLADSPKSALLRGQQKLDEDGDDYEGNENQEKVKRTRTHWKAGASVEFGGEVLKLPVERDDKCVLIEAWDDEQASFAHAPWHSGASTDGRHAQHGWGLDSTGIGMPIPFSGYWYYKIFYFLLDGIVMSFFVTNLLVTLGGPVGCGNFG